MRVTNNTAAVMNYDGKAYGPGRSFEMSDAHAAGRAEKAMLESGALGVKLGNKASEGLTVEQLKAVLTENKIEFDPAAKKADLVALVDANVA